MKIKTTLAMALGALAAGFAAAGDLAVSAYWQDHMVLQRGKNITVWGKDAPGRTVTVSFTNQTATATTGTNGYWETTFAQPFALSATPQALTITDSASESITLSDVLVGDVYLAAGQSNMDRRLKDKDKAFDEPQSVKDFCRDDDGIRFLRIARSAEDATEEKLFDLPPIKPVNDTIKYYGEGFDWAPATMGGAASNKYHVSSVALNFAHYIRRANEEKGQNIPIGIIHASSGGTFIREWIAPSVLNDNGIYSPGSASSSDGWFWNNMMAPILRAKICAVLWYQGCSDSRPDCVPVYKTMMDILVRNRREHWGVNGDLPFYAVQIGAPNYNSASGTIGLDKYPAPTEIIAGENYATIRECQRLWNMSDTGTHGLVTIVDCVDCLSNGALHPADKNFVGRRLALLARRDIYGETDLPAEGPTYTRAVRESDGSVRIFFKPGTAKGLTAGRMKPATDIAVSRWIKKDTDPIRGFAVCGSDNVWKDAVATVDGETIVLRADGVATPTKFHYGYWCVTRETLQEDGQRLNLYNDAELPMSPVAPQAVEDAAASTKVVEPVIVPGSCLFSPSTNVTITCATSGATIHYTLDGSEPTSSSSVYSAPIAISATTTIKARAFAANKEASDVVFATYTLGEPPAVTADPQWIVSSYDASSWSPLSGNILAGKTGTISGSVAFANSGYNNDPGNLTDASVPSTPDNSAYVGFQENASIYWTFDEPQTIETIRFTTQRTAGADSDVSRAYGGLRIEDVYVRTSGSSEWEPLGTPIYQKGGTVGGFMLATLADDGVGILAENVVALKVVFLRSEYYWFNVAEVEATGYATAGGTVGPVEPITPVAGSLVVDTTISDHCVLQRGTNNCVKGTATVGSTVMVTFGGVSASAVAGSDGSFSVSINPGAANATGRDLVVSDTVNTVTITDVVVGDVWYISGQSNVRYTVDVLAKSKALADCDYPSLRMMMLPSANPGLISASDAELPCAWSVCSATTCTNMSATGFFFGRELVKAENVPVGVVVAAINGSYIANWLPNANCDNYMASRANHIALKGAVWYQGESDALNYSDRSYPNRLKSLVRHLRTRPGNEGLPVVVVQLPRYRDTYINCGNQAAINCWGIFRVDQDLAAADMDGVVCVPTIEYGAEYNIHPSDKDLMGARIALAARNLAYGENVAYRCPYPTSVEKNETGTTVTVTFPETTTLVATNDTASVLFGEDRDMFSVGGANVMPAISADGHSLVFTGSFADATSVEYGICGYPKILFVDANGFPMPPFSLELTGGGSGGEPVETAATPTFSPAACSFYPATNVTLSCATSGATIRYTLNGSDPTAESAIYTAPIALSATTTVKARAYKAEMNPSAVASATYTLTDPVDPPDPPSGDHAFYVGETGYDSWAAAMNAASAGGTVYLGADAEISGTQLKSLTIDLCGHTLTASSSASPYIGGVAITVIDSSGNGMFTAPNGMNLQGTIDLSALTHDQFSIAGNRFWTGSGTVAKFPAGWTLDECKATFRNAVSGGKIVTQGVTYTWDGSNWVSDTPGHAITITAPQNGTLETSVTNNVAVGTVVTVTATPAEGYQLVSVTTNGVALAGNTFTMPSEDVTVAATFEETLIATYDITITAPQNGTLETSVTNNVAAGTTVTVIATPASGYRLASVTTNGAAIVGTTFAMPAGDVTLAATFAENAEPTQMFYIGDTGYDSWADVYAAAQNGATITVGANAVIFDTVGKTFVLDLCGRSVEITSGWWCGNVAVIDSAAPAGRFTITGASLNVQNGTLDLSALNSSQFQFTGSFWTNGSTVLKFPGDMSLSDCTAKINMGSKPVGERIVVQGVTYTWDGTSWGGQAEIAITGIAVKADAVEIGVTGATGGTVTILGCETVNGTYSTLVTTKVADGVYSVQVSDCRFFKASLN